MDESLIQPWGPTKTCGTEESETGSDSQRDPVELKREGRRTELIAMTTIFKALFNAINEIQIHSFDILF